ncbi:MAG: fasciclin domain-containing protein [Oryzihumus sp.]
MKLRRLSVILAAALAPVAAAPVASAATAHAATPSGTRSLAAVLTSRGYAFDHNWHDYDILTHAVLAVLAAKPGSPVKVLTDGTKPLTAFLPDDRAFRRLAQDLTGRELSSEQAVFDALVKKAGVNTIESVLLYHVVPGATIDAATARHSDDAHLGTALAGATVTVDVDGRRISLVDKDPNAANPAVTVPDVNQGNRQIAHGINRVLRPLDL